ncbi:MAG: hypothetical protein ACK5AW_15690, partial [Pseudanabaena sp.]
KVNMEWFARALVYSPFYSYSNVRDISDKNQNPRSEGRREVPPLTSWVLVCTSKLFFCYI